MRPSTWPFSFALAIKTASISATILNKIGDRGSPCCLYPFFSLKVVPSIIIGFYSYITMANKILHPLTPLWIKPLHTQHLLQNMPLNFIIGLFKNQFSWPSIFFLCSLGRFNNIVCHLGHYVSTDLCEFFKTNI
jgi:hypothetical protein